MVYNIMYLLGPAFLGYIGVEKDDSDSFQTPQSTLWGTYGHPKVKNMKIFILPKNGQNPSQTPF
jgi:hypothetical protein